MEDLSNSANLLKEALKRSNSAEETIRSNEINISELKLKRNNLKSKVDKLIEENSLLDREIVTIGKTLSILKEENDSLINQCKEREMGSEHSRWQYVWYETIAKNQKVHLNENYKRLEKYKEDFEAKTAPKNDEMAILAATMEAEITAENEKLMSEIQILRNVERNRKVIQAEIVDLKLRNDMKLASDKKKLEQLLHKKKQLTMELRSLGHKV